MGAVRRGQLGLHHACLLADPDLVQGSGHRHEPGADHRRPGHRLLFHRHLHRDGHRGPAGPGVRRAGRSEGIQEDLLPDHRGRGRHRVRPQQLHLELDAVPRRLRADEGVLSGVPDLLRFHAQRRHHRGAHGRGLLLRLRLGLHRLLHPVPRGHGGLYPQRRPFREPHAVLPPGTISRRTTWSTPTPPWARCSKRSSPP